MKPLLLFAFLFIASIPTTTLAREADLRINGVGLGSSQAIVLRQLGNPLKSKKGNENECGGGFYKTYEYDGLTIELLSNTKGRNYEVVSITCTSSKWVVSGIRIGAKKKAVQARFGDCLSTQIEAELTRCFYAIKNNAGNSSFYFRGDRLTRLMWGYTLC